MPPRHHYWTIILEGKPTAFRAHTEEELVPTLRQLQARHPDAVMKWFARGRLWESQDVERAEAAARRRPGGAPTGDRRPRDWRPGGEHKDPRDRFKVSRDEKRRRFAQNLHRDPLPPREDGGSPGGSDRPPQSDRPPMPDRAPRPDRPAGQGRPPRQDRPPAFDSPRPSRPAGSARGPGSGRPPRFERPPGSVRDGKPPWKRDENRGRPDWKSDRPGPRPSGKPGGDRRPPSSDRPRSDARPPSGRPPSGRPPSGRPAGRGGAGPPPAGGRFRPGQPRPHGGSKPGGGGGKKGGGGSGR